MRDGIIQTMDDFAELIYGIQGTDRWVFIACDGEMGEGKSCFTSKLCSAVANMNDLPFSYEDSITYSRKELKEWVDGEKRKPEKSSILADELISLFFKRNWYDREQIDGIELLNKCRDRHLAVIGNIPNFWDLDSAIFAALTFYIHIPRRGVAWVFRKDDNPFTSDKWHKKFNEKRFMKDRTPFRCRGFVCQINFSDWSPKEKERYYAVRNTKRRNTEGQREKKNVVEKYKKIKEQRDIFIRKCFDLDKKMTNVEANKLCPTLSIEAIRKIKFGER